MRWSDIDLDRGSLRVERTIIRVKGKGLVASRPRTHSSQRVLVLPGWCLTMLQARRARLGVAEGPVFADSLGGYRGRNNVGAAFRRVRTGTGFEWVTQHTFRKSVATLLDSKGAALKDLGVPDHAGSWDRSRGSGIQDRREAGCRKGFAACPPLLNLSVGPGPHPHEGDRGLLGRLKGCRGDALRLR